MAKWAYTIEDVKEAGAQLKPPAPAEFDQIWECVTCAPLPLPAGGTKRLMMFVWRTRSNDPTASLFDRVFGERR